jgi:two-component system C4-dicarboxylate transport response regulator DctD
MTILVVDDNDDFRTAFADALRDDGHEVEDLPAAPTGAGMARFGEVGVVVTDYRMPERDGLSFADEFHRLHPDIPVIVVTTDASEALDEAVRRRPRTVLQRKPFTYAEVMDLIRDVHSRVV